MYLLEDQMNAASGNDRECQESPGNNARGDDGPFCRGGEGHFSSGSYKRGDMHEGMSLYVAAMPVMIWELLRQLHYCNGRQSKVSNIHTEIDVFDSTPANRRAEKLGYVSIQRRTSQASRS